MNKFAAFAAAGLLSASALVAGQALAEDNPTSAFANVPLYGSSASSSDTVGYGYSAGFVSRAARQDNVHVTRVDELSDASKAIFLDKADADPASLQALHAQIAQNSNVVRGLKDRNVNVSDVIGTERAADGSVTYIVR